MLGGTTARLHVLDRVLTLLVSTGMIFGAFIYAVPTPAHAVTNTATFEVGDTEDPIPSASLDDIINGADDWDDLTLFSGDLDPGEVVVINDTGYTGAQAILSPATADEVEANCPNINDDDIIAGGTKIDDYPFVQVSGSVPGKADLCQVYVSYGFDSNGDTILYIGALRREINGTAAVAIELNKDSHANRLADDLLITFEFDGNGPISVLNVRKWNDTTQVWDLVIGISHDGGSWEHFGEVWVNLTDSDILTPPVSADDCSSFSSVFPYGFRGNSDSSQVGDWLDPAPVRIPRCGLLRIIKDSNPPSGSLEFGWNVEDNSATFPDVTGNITDGETVELELVNGTYTLTEDLIPAPYSLDRIECDGGFQPDAITVATGTTVTCTIYNEASELVVGKRGQGDSTALFPISVTGQSSFSLGLGDDSAVFAYAPGTMVDISETLPPGNPAWQAVGVECKDDFGTGSVVASSNDGSVSVDTVAGDRIVCLITNTQDGQITVVKKVINDDGGTLGIPDFPLFLNSDPVTSHLVNYVPAGTYTASETSQTGYTASGPVCVDDDTSQAVSHPVNLSPGQAVTCTITNDDNPGTLTLLKKVTSLSGGSASDTEWTLSADGPTSISGVEDDGSITNAGVPAGDYDLSESNGPFGWQQLGDWNCFGAPINSATVTVGLGENVTCEVTNTDIAPLLTLVKVLDIQHGGNATLDDFILTATGPPTISGVTGHPDVTNAPVDTGSYTLSESGPPGYTQVGDWNCLGGSFTGPDQIELGPGEQATCTVTNTDSPPELIVVKVVENNHGGDAVAGDFQLYVEGVPVDQNSAVPGIVANTSYTVTEDQEPGYTQVGDVVCEDNDTSQAVTHPVTLAEGQSVTCTITNQDVEPGLVVVKVVENNHGGDAVAGDFQLRLNGSAVNQNENLDVDANVVYTVTEDPLAGYDQVGDVVCVDDNTQQAVSHPVTLAEGQSVTCTITNQDIAPELMVIKVVENNHGGDAVASDFQLRLNSDPVAQNIFLDVDSNTAYTVTEDQEPGYTQVGDVVCEDNDTSQAVTHPVTLAEGQSVTCTITNQDVEPGLVVVKVVENNHGGDAVAGDFQLRLNGSAVNQNENLDVDANVVYTVTEDPLSGYEQVGDVVCVDDNTQQAVSHPVTLAEGQSVTCTITNQDIAPELMVVKVVENNHGGDAVASDFQLRLNSDAVAQNIFLDVDTSQHLLTPSD